MSCKFDPNGGMIAPGKGQNAWDLWHDFGRWSNVQCSLHATSTKWRRRGFYVYMEEMVMSKPLLQALH